MIFNQFNGLGESEKMRKREKGFETDSEAQLLLPAPISHRLWRNGYFLSAHVGAKGP